jgi:hypothetical protein
MPFLMSFLCLWAVELVITATISDDERFQSQICFTIRCFFFVRTDVALKSSSQ